MGLKEGGPAACTRRGRMGNSWCSGLALLRSDRLLLLRRATALGNEQYHPVFISAQYKLYKVPT